ncbi:MAG: alpha-amylase family glycosyl hydrolase, partial [Chloroflexota bacterium]
MVRVPTATYRIQLSQQCTFGRATELAGYLHTLGISDLYASPILKAQPSSGHGYDITDPSRINPELGGGRGFWRLHRELVRYGMGLLLDIVPNHLAASPENPYWADVLKHGRGSRYARHFDIRWNRSGMADGQVLLPVLARPYGEALEKGELRLVVEKGRLGVRYGESTFPLTVRSWSPILSACRARPEMTACVDAQTWQRLGSVADEVERLRHEGATMAAQRREKRVEEGIERLIEGAPGIRAAVHRAVLEVNGRPGCPRSFDLLDALLREQHYRLAYWKTASEEINYRRFFDIGDLVGVRVEDEEVLRGTHRVVFRLVDRGAVTGLRVDHVDGLRDPGGYLGRLQQRLGREVPFYVVVEKVL